MTFATAFATGALFAIGLLISGMTVPAKVVGFLDVGGAWDPTLAFVMAGAIAVHAPIARLVRRMRAPLLAPGFHGPARTAIDPALLVGAAVFGVGWGLSGYCPGPALVNLGAGAVPVLAFVAAAIAGIAATRAVQRAASASRPSATSTGSESPRPGRSAE